VKFFAERLCKRHGTAAFDSGKPELDMWLRESAAHAQSNNTSRTFVWHDGDQQVVAYYSLAAHLITREELGRKIGRGSPDYIPAILLARLALSTSLRGQGLGSVLLAEALGRAVAACQSVGARFVVVDASDAGAVAFYANHGFMAVPDDEHRLVRKLSDIAAELAED
jgi:predicted GNAT family N-acyltransferase